ncbi:granzyme M [Tupaia chinensis]|uniref:granzyme M n=1 Tax=Tupaia chinensis TaxID=246437 RepID=UPI000FFB50F1|nr:granzyme M [Tupaia chinensis]
MEAGLSCLLLLALGAPSAGGGWSEAQIIGGHEAAPHSHPYMASLQKSGSHLCGAALVHPRWVLTAAHCLGSRTDRLRLVLGLHQLDGPGLPFRIKAVVTHPYYKPAPDLENDLALLQLDGKVKSTRTIRALALPRGRRAVATGVRCSMAGWGLTQRGGRLARALQELDLRVLDTRMCNNSRFWHGRLPGDSGGPVVCGHGGVAGILSFSSKSCTDVFKPPVATAVAPYVPWIKKVIGRWHPGVSAAPAHESVVLNGFPRSCDFSFSPQSSPVPSPAPTSPSLSP